MSGPTVVPPSAAEINITIFQGDTWDGPIFQHTGVSFAGYAIRAQVRTIPGAATAALSLSSVDGSIVIVDNGAPGRWRPNVSSTVMAALVLNGQRQTWYWDVEMYVPGSSPPVVRKLMFGLARVIPEITR